MSAIFIGIAGGTGAGKSTVCTALMDKYPDLIGLVQLDDYFKPAAQVPKIDGHENWDHPDALFLDKLVKDLAEFSRGKSVIIHTKNPRLNPDFPKTQKRIPMEFHPKKIMLVEGYLVLWDERIRKFLSTSVWLDLSHETRWSRRVHFKYPEYEQKVLKPMHREFVEPSKKYAEHVLDVAALSQAQVLEKVEEIVAGFF